MNKSELVEKMAQKAGLNKEQAAKALSAFTEVVSEAMKANDTVTLVGFGTFSIKERQARTGRNPQTGEEMQIPASRVPSFKAGKSLKDSANGVEKAVEKSEEKDTAPETAKKSRAKKDK